MRLTPILALSLGFALPAAAEEVLGEASGNWAGEGGGGFFFRAELVDYGDEAGLRIWNDLSGVPLGGEPQLDVKNMVWSGNLVEPGEQRLEVVTTVAGTSLNLITESADEQYGTREVVVLSFLDNQFTVTGYHFRIISYDPAEAGYECDVDTMTGEMTVNGVRVEAPDVPFGELNASLWNQGRTAELGYCPPG